MNLGSIIRHSGHPLRVVGKVAKEALRPSSVQRANCDATRDDPPQFFQICLPLERWNKAQNSLSHFFLHVPEMFSFGDVYAQCRPFHILVPQLAPKKANNAEALLLR